MPKRVQIVWIVTALVLTSCGTKIMGKMYALDDGTVLEFQIERSYGTGGMYAQDPITGEKFSGQYTGIYRSGGTATTFGSGGYSGSTTSSGTGNVYHHSGTVSSTSTTIVPPTYATARGVLIGNQGTVIQIFLEIRPGLVPKGHGEGTDQRGRRYQVQF